MATKYEEVPVCDVKHPLFTSTTVCTNEEKEYQNQAKQASLKPVQNQIQVYDLPHNQKSGTVVYLPLHFDADSNTFKLPFTSLTAKFPTAGNLYHIYQGQKIIFKPGLSGSYTPHPKNFSELEAQLCFCNDNWQFSEPYIIGYENEIELPMAAALSGGGFRATLIHLGFLRRLNELKKLSKIDTFTSVSGGSITNAFLATAWYDLQENDFSEAAFEKYVAQPVYKFCSHNFAIEVIIKSKFNPQSWRRRLTSKTDTSAQFLAEKYAEVENKIKNGEGYFGKTLRKALPQPGPQTPRFIFCGTDVRNGKPFHFTHYQVGFNLKGLPRVKTSFEMADGEQERLAKNITLAQAVAASSAFPLAFQPLIIAYKSPEGTEKLAYVTDGGVYDNLGLDPVLAVNPYINHPCHDNENVIDVRSTIPEMNDVPHKIAFLSDAGKPLGEQEDVWLSFTARRVIDIISYQSDAVRHSIVKEKFKNKSLYGAMCSTYDLWRYYLLIEKFVSSEVSSKHKHKVKELLDELPAQHEYPDIKNMFHILLEKLKDNISTQFVPIPFDGEDLFEENTDLKEASDKAKAMIAPLLAFRTDLNAFDEPEMRVLEAIGYATAAYRIQIYCSELFANMLHEETPKFNEKMKEQLQPEVVIKALQFSTSLVDANIKRRIRNSGLWKLLGFR